MRQSSITRDANAVHPLDNPVWHALTGPHARFAESTGAARRYPAEAAFFAAVDELDDASLADVARLADDQFVVLVRRTLDALGAAADEQMRLHGHQYVLPDGVALTPPPAGVTIERLTTDDVPEMLALTRAAAPGPFFARTIELGDYHGVRDEGRLVAMAGERLHLDGWCEISAVCTDASARRRGLGAAVTAAVAHGIRARGETPMLHVAQGNDAACALYEAMGFAHRADLDFVGVRAAGATPG
jgi:predicted GNAT family acetyltransferase